MSQFEKLIKLKSPLVKSPYFSTLFIVIDNSYCQRMSKKFMIWDKNSIHFDKIKFGSLNISNWDSLISNIDNDKILYFLKEFNY